MTSRCSWGKKSPRLMPPPKPSNSKTVLATSYDSLLLATGGIARRLEAPGGDLANIFTLRNIEDADRHHRGSPTREPGGGRGGQLHQHGGGPEPHQARGQGHGGGRRAKFPSKKSWARKLAGCGKSSMKNDGVAFRMQARVDRFEGEGRVQAVVLEGGERLPADLVVLGLGVKPATGFVQGITLNQDGSVPVDRYLKAGDGLYAAGDIARFPGLAHGRIHPHRTLAPGVAAWPDCRS